MCYQCNQPGHLREDCDKLRREVFAFLNQQAAARGRGHGNKGRGRGHGRLAVAGISTASVQRMVDSLPGESSAFLPNKWLVDSGADLNICLNYELFSYTGTSDIDICTPIGSTPLDVHGRGVVKICVGPYVDHDGLSDPIDLEIDDVYWVPQCPMNELATPCIAEQKSVCTLVLAAMSCTCRGLQIRRLASLECAPKRWIMMATLSWCSIWARVDLS